MLKVLVVDDEAVVRIGLRSMIDWEANGFTVVADASDGRQAMVAAARESPDIVITDIVMPVMDGLELMRRSASLAKKPVFIVLSGHDDFPLVKKAMQLGAVDYLLKLQTNPPDLLAILHSVKERMERERSGGTAEAAGDGVTAAALRISRKGFLRDVLGRFYRDDAELGRALAALGIRFRGRRISCAAIRISEVYRFEDLPEEEASKLNLGVATIAEDIARETGSAYCFDARTGEFPLLMDPLPQARMIRCGERILEMIGQYLNLQGAIGVGEGDLGVDGIQGAYRQACAALRARFFDATRKVFFARDAETAGPGTEEYRILARKDALEKALIHHDAAGIACLFDSIRADLSRLRPDRDSLRGMVIELHAMVCEFLCRNQIPVEQVFRGGHALRTRLVHMDSLAEVLAWLAQLQGDLESFLMAEERKNYSRIIARARSFIESRSTEDLSLPMVADAVRLNPSYFSTLFKHHTGQGFLSYLTEVRVSRAKKLLKESDLKVYEIAERTGYENPYYFNRIFKKMTGMTPGEYRNA